MYTRSIQGSTSNKKDIIPLQKYDLNLSLPINDLTQPDFKISSLDTKAAKKSIKESQYQKNPQLRVNRTSEFSIFSWPAQCMVLYIYNSIRTYIKSFITHMLFHIYCVPMRTIILCGNRLQYIVQSIGIRGLCHSSLWFSQPTILLSANSLQYIL